MPNDKNARMLSHDDVVRSFLASDAINFKAMGAFVAELGPSLAQSRTGEYGVKIGHYNILACFKIGPQTLGNDGIAGGMASDVIGQ